MVQKGGVDEALVVHPLVCLGALKLAVEKQDLPKGTRLEELDILELADFRVQQALDAVRPPQVILDLLLEPKPLRSHREAKWIRSKAYRGA